MNYQRKKQQIKNSFLISKSKNIRSRKHLLSNHYLYCENCKQFNDGLCPQGCQIYATNQEADHAKYTVPIGIVITNSNIPDAGLGAFAIESFPKNTYFGPYTGERHRSIERANRSGYAWAIEDAKGNVYNYIDATNPCRSNWLRYVNCSTKEENENLVAIQFYNELYYRTLRDVKAGEELLVYYGDEYAKALGIHPFKHHLKT